MDKWQRIKYQPNTPLEKNRRVTACKEHIELSKNAAKEGMVLLKNQINTLPLKYGTKVALFGKASFDYVKGGGGSGDVTVEYIRNLYDGIKSLNDYLTIYEPLSDFYRDHVKNEYKTGKEPGLTTEPQLSDELLKQTRAFTDTAIVSISRFSGEAWDRKVSSEQKEIQAEPWVEKFAKQSNELFEDGDFTLSRNEATLIEKLKELFPKIIVVLNVGGVIDTKWFANESSIQSVLLSWQGGMEGGLAIAEILCGFGNPSGKLVDTFATELTDYPSTYNYFESKEYVDYTDDIFVGYRYFETVPMADKKVNYPFGFGLSYSTFEWKIIDSAQYNEKVEVKVEITNMGNYPGREVMQLYSIPPQGVLGKASKNLIAFKKTRLLKSGETQKITLEFNIEDLASYDDLGKVEKSCYIIEQGIYNFFLGTSVRDGKTIDFTYTAKSNQVVKKLQTLIKPNLLSKRLKSDGSFEKLKTETVDSQKISPESVQKASELDGYQPQSRFLKHYKQGELDNFIKLIDVYEGVNSLEEFINQLDSADLANLLGGQPNIGVANTFGFGNLQEYGVPNVMTADGPAGLRINRECGVTTTAWPCATLLACTWDEEILFKVGQAGAKEVKENNLGIWLTPAINIHRSPLCGRNFEYYSEDPLITGKMAAAMVKGIQSTGISSAVKHFALNNKETNRKNSDSRVSERAAREIYLKGFEITVKEADPWCIMSSYNIINGVRASENRELLEDILREEWGFKGVVTTDWWTHGEHSKEVAAGNDIKMGCGFPEMLLKAVDSGNLDINLIKKSAKRVLELILKID